MAIQKHLRAEIMSGITQELKQLQQAYRSINPAWIEPEKVVFITNKIAQLKKQQYKDWGIKIIIALLEALSLLSMLVLSWATLWLF